VSTIIYGKNPVIETLKKRPSQIIKIIIAKEKDDATTRTLRELAERQKVSLAYEPRQALDQLAGSAHHQGVLAIVSPFEEATIDEIIKRWQRSGEKLLALVVDGIQDPQNLGALIRTACACGVHGVIVPKDRSASITAAVFKASAGAIEHVPIAREVNIARTLDYFKKKGAWIVGTDAQSSMSLYDLDGSLDLALVIGSEGRGIRPLVKKKCDVIVHIPLRGAISSLNASAAGAVALYEIVRQRYYPKEKELTK